MNFILKGRIYYTIKGINRLFEADDWNIINSNTLHSNIYVEEDDHFEAIAVLISSSFVEKWVGKNVIFINPENEEITARIKLILTSMAEIYNLQTNLRNLQLMEKIFELLTLLATECSIYKNEDVKVLTMHELEKTKKAIDYIENNFKKKLDLEELAAYMNYSPSYFSRFFKDKTGENFYSYLSNVRLAHAVLAMRNPDVTSIECALENGFPNVKAFIETFKKVYGCTPSQYKKRIFESSKKVEE